jgi:BirA family biotin operon repressor/biotin-[acetyl-CoA-carboxylase] ligase
VKTGAKPPATTEVLDLLIANFEGWRIRLIGEGFAPIRTAWLARAHGLGAMLRTSAGQSGIFEDLSKEGALVLRQNSGRSIEISAGEVFFADQEN